MIRKLVVILLTGVMCLIGVTSVLAVKTGPVLTFTGMETLPLPEKYSEAPMLRTKVAAGVLPPVEERLPEEPLVVKPVGEIGQYGGALYEASIGPKSVWDPGQDMTEQDMFQVNNACTEVLPDVAKGYEFSEDKKILTIFLRRGMKWSDGAPFTADDIIFWWEDEVQNKELSPGGPPYWLREGGQTTELEKVDDYTVRLRFSKPFPTIFASMARWLSDQSAFYDPKHYLKKYHIKYNPNANELAKKAGYDTWWQAYPSHRGRDWWVWEHVGVPVVSPWILEEVTSSARIWVRNPYFYAVDTAGKQLPYIDRVVVATCGDRETVNMKTVAGELSFSGIMLSIENYPLYLENAEEGDYRVLLWKNSEAAAWFVAFNLNHPDPVLRKIFQDVKFRQAMSLAIDRDEINKVVYYGMAMPCQSAPSPDCSFYKKEWGEAYAQHDPETANALLDEMGLKWDVNHQYRLRPDGKTLSVIMLMTSTVVTETKTFELVKEYWEKVGLKVNLKTAGRTLRKEQMKAGTFDTMVSHLTNMEEIWCSTFDPDPDRAAWAVRWAQWKDTEGESGEEPPEEWKEQWERIANWRRATTEEEYLRLAQEVYDFYSEQVIFIGTVGYGPRPIVVKNNLRNVPEEALYRGSKSLYPMQWYFEK